MKKKVVIGLSGGVDSSAAAIILLEKGYDVIGVTFLLCDGEQSVAEDAKKVADHLKIPFFPLDYRKEFQENVIRPFADEYTKGRTPNPCIECNRYIKFPLLLKAAEKFDADYIATGHYARVEENNGVYSLLRCADRKKDQTYFLYTLNQEVLAKVLFPLYGTEKDEVRLLAEKYGVPTAKKKESQEICFVPNDDHGTFLSEKLGISSPHGDFVLPNGEIVGTHKGIIHYTIGQRRWLGVSLGRRIFVTDIDEKENIIKLGENEDLFHSVLYASKENWIESSPSFPLRCTAKVRYAAAETNCTVTRFKEGLRIEFDTPQRAMTPGQSVVFYDQARVLGGAVADSIE